MKICICDDEITQMAYVQNFVNSHFPQINNSNDPISFTQLLPETLINLLNNHLFDFDLIILDIRLGKINKEINGIDLAKKINIEAPFCQIIFLTGYVDFAPYVYEADHLYFVLKTQLDTMMPKALEKAARKICSKVPPLTLNISNYEVKVPLDKILYIEKKEHLAIIATESKTLSISMSLKNLQTMLGTDFVRCHGSYIVNLKNVSSYKSTEFVLNNNIIIPIGRTFQQSTKKAYLDYLALSL